MEKDKSAIIWILAGIFILMLAFGSYFGMGGYGMMGFGFPFMILFWGIIVGFAYFLFNAAQSGNQQSKNGEDAIGILKKRYANAEITKKEFETMKKELNK